LKSSTTFYGKWGFKPSLYSGNTSFETNKEKIKRLCQLVSRLQKQKMSSIITNIEKTHDALVGIKDPSTLQTYNITDDYRSGVKEHDNYEDDWDASKIKRLQEKLTSITKYIVKYKNTTLHEMMQHCSCEEFQYLLQAFKLPGVLVIGKKKYINKLFPLYHEIHFLLSNSEYVLDLTKKASKSTC
jgi:hypothetical protein